MAVDSGSGSPGTDSGAGSPTPGASGDTGAGSPTQISSSSDSGSGPGSGPQLAMELRLPFSTDADNARLGFDPAYPEDGGALVEVRAAWPTAGPIQVWLRDSDGALHPSADEPCHSAVPGQGRLIYTNASQRYIRFALPKLKLGTYDLLVFWEGGSALKTAALRIVPRQVARATTRILDSFGTFPQLERRAQDGP